MSDGLRNLTLQHTDSGVLRRHYLSHEIKSDTLAITRCLERQRALVKSTSSLGSSTSKRRPIWLTDEQYTSVNSSPRVRELIRRRDKLYALSKLSAIPRRKYERAAKDVINEKTRLRKLLEGEIRDEFDSKQTVVEIELQFAGLGFADMEKETLKWAAWRCRPKESSTPTQAPILITQGMALWAIL